MISFIRTRFKAKSTQIIIWIAIFSLVGFYSVPELFKRLFGTPDWVLSINGTKISRDEFAHKIEEEKHYIDYLRQQFGPYATKLFSSGMDFDPKKLATEALINKVLFDNIAKLHNLQFDPSFLQQEIVKKMPSELLQVGQLDLQSLSTMLGYPNVEVFQNVLESGLKQNMIMDWVGASVYIPNFELKNNYVSSYSSRKYEILVFPFDKYLNSVKKIGLTKEEIKKFFDIQNKEKKYWIPEGREIVKWEFEPSSYGIKVNDKEIESYYNKNKTTQFVANPLQIQIRRILFAVKDPKEKPIVMQKAQKVYAELVQNKSKFAELAKQHSDDKESALKGGLLDFFSKDSTKIDPRIEKTAFTLKQNNDISSIFESDQGFEIIQRITKKPVTFKKLEEVKDKIKDTLEKEKFNKLFNIDVKKFINDPKNQQAFEEFLNKKCAKEVKVGSIKDDSSTLAQKTFSIKSENNLAAFIENNKGTIIKLLKVKKSHLPSLESIQKTVENDLYLEKAKKKLEEDVKNAKKLSSSKSLNQIKNEFDVVLKEVSIVNPKDPKEIQKLQKENIPTVLLLNMQKEGQTAELAGELGGYLMKLIKIEPFDREKFEIKKNELEQELFRKRKQDLELGFIASLKNDAKIDINEKILKQFNKVR